MNCSTFCICYIVLVPGVSSAIFDSLALSSVVGRQLLLWKTWVLRGWRAVRPGFSISIRERQPLFELHVWGWHVPGALLTSEMWHLPRGLRRGTDLRWEMLSSLYLPRWRCVFVNLFFSLCCAIGYFASQLEWTITVCTNSFWLCVMYKTKYTQATAVKLLLASVIPHPPARDNVWETNKVNL